MRQFTIKLRDENKDDEIDEEEEIDDLNLIWRLAMLINLEQSDLDYVTENEHGQKIKSNAPKFIISILPERMVILLLNKINQGQDLLEYVANRPAFVRLKTMQLLLCLTAGLTNKYKMQIASWAIQDTCLSPDGKVHSHDKGYYILLWAMALWYISQGIFS